MPRNIRRLLIWVMTLVVLAAKPLVVAHADKGGNANGGGHSGGSGNGGGNGNGNGGGNANGRGNGNAGANSNAGGNGQAGNGVASASVKISAASGGTVSAGSVTLTLPSGALVGVGDSVNVTLNPASNVPVPGGPAQFSPNGTLADIVISDGRGVQVTTFPAPLTLGLKYNAADLAMAHGDPRLLSAAFVVDANTPALENPLHFPIGTFILASNAIADPVASQVVVQTQALGSVVAVVANPLSFVQTLEPRTAMYSSFDPTSSVVLGTKPQFRVLQLVEPQIGTRLVVLDPDSGNYAYVDAASVGPSGPPPNVASAGVTRGLLVDVAP